MIKNYTIDATERLNFKHDFVVVVSIPDGANSFLL